LPVDRIGDGGAKFEEVPVDLSGLAAIPCKQGIEQGILPILIVLPGGPRLLVFTRACCQLLAPRKQGIFRADAGNVDQRTGNSRDFDAALLLADPMTPAAVNFSPTHHAA
jgi:hypothetical protein